MLADSLSIFLALAGFSLIAIIGGFERWRFESVPIQNRIPNWTFELRNC
jgi:hypothetical protein